MQNIKIVIQEEDHVFIGSTFESVSQVYKDFNLKDSDDLLMAWSSKESSKFLIFQEDNSKYCLIYREGEFYNISCYKDNDLLLCKVNKDHLLSLLRPSLLQSEFIKNIKKALEEY